MAPTVFVPTAAAGLRAFQRRSVQSNDGENSATQCGGSGRVTDGSVEPDFHVTLQTVSLRAQANSSRYTLRRDEHENNTCGDRNPGDDLRFGPGNDRVAGRVASKRTGPGCY